MKILVFLVCLLGLFSQVIAQNLPPGFPTNLPPEALEMYKKMMPAGIKIPGINSQKEDSSSLKPLIDILPFQVPSFPHVASIKFDYSPFGSGRTDAQRRAVLIEINGELGLKQILLTKKENIPTKADLLKIAERRNKMAQEKFETGDYSKYKQAITWIPNFEGRDPDPKKASDYSLFVSTITNNYNLPQLVVALSSSIFALDPESHVSANNFAAAILTAGENLGPSITKSNEMATYRKDAESGFLYAMAVSKKENAWTEESLPAIVNLGNLYLDMGKLEEARSLFMLARKISPSSWDAALGLAAYFHAIHQPNKALAIMEDDNLDRPAKYLQAVKAAKSLEKSDPYTSLSPETPDQVYEEGIKIMASDPITTAADFMSQLDQSERNKMTYFIEHLAPKGSFKAPLIKNIAQFGSLKAISSPEGISALKDFMESMSQFSVASVALSATQQLEMLSRLGMNIDLGFDLNDAAQHPEKYVGKINEGNIKIEGMDKLMANVANMQKEAQNAQRDLTTGKTASTIALGAQIDPSLNILKINPEQYADPMNVIIQKHNFAVFNRKTNLYRGYLYSVNKRLYGAINDIIQKANKKIYALEKSRRAEIEKLEAQHIGGLAIHAVHTKYFNQFNNVAEVAFNSATNLIIPAYDQKIKPTAEAYYYDVIRHIALISDPEVRSQKETELRSSINSYLAWALHTVLLSYGSFSYSDDWDCKCDIGELYAQWEAEQAAISAEENARLLRNKQAKKRFDSGEIPESTPLFKKIDSYGTDYNFGFIKGRISCARTTAYLNIPIPVAGSPEISGSYKSSAFTGASTYGGGVKVSVKLEGENKAYKTSAFLSLSGSVSTDGKGNISDYSVTAATGVSVSAKGTTLTVGGEVSYGPKGLEVGDVSAGVSRDVSDNFGKNVLGQTGKVSFEASTKRGCSMSGKVEQSLGPYTEAVDKVKEKEYGENLAKAIPLEDLFKRETWSGKFKTK